MQDAAKVERIIKGLKQNQESGFHCIGFLLATVNNDNVGRVVSHSFSGQALDTAIRCTIEAVVMFVARALDANGHSLPQLVKAFEGSLSLIRDRRRQKKPDWDDRLLRVDSIESDAMALKESTLALQSDPRYKAIKLHRDEFLAHSLPNASGFRRNFVTDGENVVVTYSELLDISQEVSRQISKAILLWDFEYFDADGFIEIQKEYAEKLWEILPSLSSLEEA